MRLRRILSVVAILAAVLVVAPLVPAPDDVVGFRLRAYGTHAAWFGLVLVLVVLVVPGWNLPRRHLATWLVGLAAVIVVASVLGIPWAVDLPKVAFGALAGAAFVGAIERPWWLLPICVLVPAADAWSVYSEHGVTNEVVDRAAENPDWILWPTIATPIAGFGYDQFGRLGIVDVLFAGLFLGVAVRWGWPVWRGLVALLAGLLATSALVFESSDVAIPALPMLCVAFLVAYGPQLVRDARSAWRERGMSETDAPDSFTE